MTVPVGGLRARLIRESLYQMLYTGVSELGWFDPGRDHATVTFNSEPLTPSNEIQPNTCVLNDSNITDDEMELGSNLLESSWVFYIDFFAEDDAVGLHFSRDMKDIVQGRIASIGRTGPTFPVYDYTQATPPVLFVCQIENVALSRPTVISQPYQKHWFSVSLDVIDSYTSESG